MFYSSYWLYMIPAIVLTLLAQLYVNSTYRKWSKIRASSRVTGAEAAQRLIRYEGLTEVQIQGVRGNLTDHYDPRKKCFVFPKESFEANR